MANCYNCGNGLEINTKAECCYLMITIILLICKLYLFSLCLNTCYLNIKKEFGRPGYIEYVTRLYGSIKSPHIIIIEVLAYFGIIELTLFFGFIGKSF